MAGLNGEIWMSTGSIGNRGRSFALTKMALFFIVVGFRESSRSIRTRFQDYSGFFRGKKMREQKIWKKCEDFAMVGILP